MASDVSTEHSALLFRVAQVKGMCLCPNSALTSPVLRSHVFCLSDVLCAAKLRTEQQNRCTIQLASHSSSHVQPNISIVYIFLCSVLAGNDAVLCSSSFCKHVHKVKYTFSLFSSFVAGQIISNRLVIHYFLCRTNVSSSKQAETLFLFVISDFLKYVASLRNPVL